MTSGTLTDEIDVDHVLVYVALALAFGVPFVGKKLADSRFKAATSAESLEDKLAIFRTGYILRMATMEGPSLFSIILLLLTGFYPVLFIALAMLYLQYKIWPSFEFVATQLALGDLEKEELRSHWG